MPEDLLHDLRVVERGEPPQPAATAGAGQHVDREGPLHERHPGRMAAGGGRRRPTCGFRGRLRRLLRPRHHLGPVARGGARSPWATSGFTRGRGVSAARRSRIVSGAKTSARVPPVERNPVGFPSRTSDAFEIGVDADDNIFIDEGGPAHRIQKFDSSGTYLLQWGSGGSHLGEFLGPLGVTVGPNGTIYVLDNWEQPGADVQLPVELPRGDLLASDEGGLCQPPSVVIPISISASTAQMTGTRRPSRRRVDIVSPDSTDIIRTRRIHRSYAGRSGAANRVRLEVDAVAETCASRPDRR